MSTIINLPLYPGQKVYIQRGVLFLHNEEDNNEEDDSEEDNSEEDNSETNSNVNDNNNK